MGVSGVAVEDIKGSLDVLPQKPEKNLPCQEPFRGGA